MFPYVPLVLACVGNIFKILSCLYTRASWSFGSFHKAEKTVPERHEGENAGKTREGAMNSGHIV